MIRPNGTMSKVELLKTGKQLETVNCRDYNALAMTYRPQALVHAPTTARTATRIPP